MDSELIEKLSAVAKALFNLGVLSIGSGSISARVEMSRFVIDKKYANFHNILKENFILLNHTRDYRWNDASFDVEIHSYIYQNIDNAKFVSFAAAPYTIAYTLNHHFIEPVDFFGKSLCKSIKIYDPKENFTNWYQRAPVEILRALEDAEKEFVVVRGYGIVAYAREAGELASIMATVENSCKILLLNSTIG